jgi:signal transduction histidine kinase
MSYHWLIPLIAAVASLGLAFFVNRAGPRGDFREVFTFTAITLVFWNLIFVVLYSVTDYGLAFYLSTVVRSGAIYLFAAILHLCIVLPGRPRHPILWNLLILDYAASFCLVIANALGWFVDHLQVFSWGYYSVGTVLYHLFSGFVIINFLGSFALVIYEYRTTTEPRMRLQLQFWLVGLAVGLPLGLTNLFPIYGVPIYPLGNLGSAAWAAIVAYAIVRHRLMDIDVVITKGIAYAGVTVLLIGPAFAISLLLQRWAFDRIHYDFSFAMLVLLIAIGVAFPVLRSSTEAMLERSLFRQKQANRAKLTTFARSVVTILDRDRLIRELCETISDVFRLDHVQFFLLDENREKFLLAWTMGTNSRMRAYRSDDEFVGWLAAQAEPVLKDEVKSLGDATGPKIAVHFEENGWEVCLPLAGVGGMVGLLCLGRKQELEAYSSGDLQILGNLAAEAAIALENARLYSELRKSRDIINRAGRLSALGTLAAGIAHEIRNPLVSVQTFFQLAPQRLGDEEFMSSFLKLAEEEVKRICQLITELLSFAKSPSTSSHDIDVTELVERTMVLLAPHARAQQVRLSAQSNPEMPAVQADPDRIRQVLINLVLNAIQATPAGGRVTLGTRQIENERGLFCQIEIEDTGVGIPSDMQEAIFNPFFTTKEKGTGLGLSIAHQIVSECGGFIAVDSVEGQGSRFAIHLPIALVEDSDEGQMVLYGSG